MSSIEDLRVLANSINAASDKLNEIIAETENQLSELNLGVEAWTDYIYEGNQWQAGLDNCQDMVRLGWAKYASKWRLVLKTVVKRESTFNKEHRVADPLSLYTVKTEYISVPAKPRYETKSVERAIDANRALRAAAVKNIPLLFESIHREAQAVLDAVEIKR